MGYRYHSDIVFLFSLGIFPEVKLLDHKVVLVLTFQGTSILFSIGAVPIYKSTENILGFPFLYVLTSIRYVLCF